jgi:hypothetical protein
MSHPNTPYETDDGTVVHEFKPLPDRTPEEQVTALTQIVHQMSQNCFEVRLELNDLREQNVEYMRELLYLRSIVDETSRANYKTLTKN